MNLKLKIFRTVWVNLLVIFLAVYIFIIASELLFGEGGLANSLIIGFAGGLFSIFGYGIMFWLGFVVATLILDLVLIKKQEANLTLKLVIEWVIVSSPFVYWAFKHNTWVFLVAVIAFLIAQVYWRRKKIDRVLKLD